MRRLVEGEGPEEDGEGEGGFDREGERASRWLFFGALDLGWTGRGWPPVVLRSVEGDGEGEGVGFRRQLQLACLGAEWMLAIAGAMFVPWWLSGVLEVGWAVLWLTPRKRFIVGLQKRWQPIITMFPAPGALAIAHWVLVCKCCVFRSLVKPF